MIHYLLGALIALVVIAVAIAEPMLVITVIAVAAGYLPLMWAARWVRRARQPIRTAFSKEQP